VIFVDMRCAYIDETVKIGAGTVIGPCVTLEGNTVIGENCVIGQNTRIKDSVIAERVEIQSSVITESEVGEGTKVGPFAYMRPGSKVGKDCKVGDFVEIKNSTFGDGSKASHLTYIGDSDVGSGVNLGCGVVFVNYDGTNKYRSTVGDGAFIGCNSNLVSPVNVGEGAYIAAGSTVTEDVEADALYVARARGTKKQGWVSAKGILKKKKK
jgi:bifunctional UDP-N-acetylglucosamine pyrophosphorylase/glucosamine-1-phosphate N-acetyltransferase